jgi:hypothetical protein
MMELCRKAREYVMGVSPRPIDPQDPKHLNPFTNVRSLSARVSHDHGFNKRVIKSK